MVRLRAQSSLAMPNMKTRQLAERLFWGHQTPFPERQFARHCKTSSWIVFVTLSLPRSLPLSIGAIDSTPVQWQRSRDLTQLQSGMG